MADKKDSKIFWHEVAKPYHKDYRRPDNAEDTLNLNPSIFRT